MHCKNITSVTMRMMTGVNRHSCTCRNNMLCRRISSFFPWVFKWLLLSAFLLSLPLIIVILICGIVTAKHPPQINIHDSEKTYKDPNVSAGGSCSDCTFPSMTDKASIELSVVIPAYNEENRLPSMLVETVDFLEKRKTETPTFSYEIIIVDDGSGDKTTDVGISYTKVLTSEKCRVLTLARNLGKGGAVTRGVLVSRGKYVLFADADGATRFSDLNKLEAKLKDIISDQEEGGYGLVCGSRAHLEKESACQRSLLRTILMKGFHVCVRAFGCKTVLDTQCGFKLMTRKTAKIVFHSLHVKRWVFDVELIKIAEILKIPTAEVSVCWTEIDGSKLHPIRASVQMFIDLFFLWLRYFVGVWKVVDINDIK